VCFGAGLQLPLVPRHTLGSGSRLCDRSYERWLTLENLSLQERLPVDDSFQDSGVVNPKPRERDLY